MGNWSDGKNWTLTEDILDISVNLQEGIVTSLLHGNCKENLTTSFFFLQIDKADFKGLIIFIDFLKETAHTSAKTNVFVVTFLAAIFGDQKIKGFREKGE